MGFIAGVAATVAVLWVAGAISDGIHVYRVVTRKWAAK